MRQRNDCENSMTQTFTCWCGLKTYDLTRPCPHWWGLLWGFPIIP